VPELLKLRSTVSECKPLPERPRGPRRVAAVRLGPGRGLHSFPIQLNLSALYGIGGARRGSVSRVKGVLGGVQGV